MPGVPLIAPDIKERLRPPSVDFCSNCSRLRIECWSALFFDMYSYVWHCKVHGVPAWAQLPLKWYVHNFQIWLQRYTVPADIWPGTEHFHSLVLELNSDLRAMLG